MYSYLQNSNRITTLFRVILVYFSLKTENGKIFAPIKVDHHIQILTINNLLYS